jgi:hypothetical protein
MRQSTVGRAALCAVFVVLSACGSLATDDSSSGAAATSVPPNSSASSVVALSSATYTVSPSASAVILVNRIGTPTGGITVSYSTLNGTAVSGTDYELTSGSISWADGDQVSKTITVPVNATASGKDFAVVLTSVSGDASFGSPTAATVAIGGASAASVSASSSGSSSTSGSTSGGSSGGSNASANGAMLPPGTQLVDSAGNQWTVAGGVIALNGKAQSVTQQVILLLYYNGVIYQENSNCNWWSWSSGAWVATEQPAAGGIPACRASPTAVVSGSSSSSGSTTSSGTAPAPAAAVGYDTQTFGPAVTLSSNWFPFNFYGGSTPAAAYSQNSDGSVYLSGAGNVNAGADIATAFQTSSGNKWSGTAFGGGAYFEATLSFTNQSNGPYTNGGPAFWGLDVEHTSQGPYPVSWPGMPNDSSGNPYDDFFEVDFMEYDCGTYCYQNGIGNWYGYPPTKSTSNPFQAVGGSAGSVLIDVGTDFSQYHKYGCLWVPATPNTQGYLKFYFDGTQVGQTFYWNYNNPANPYPPPPLNNATAMSGMDQRHLFMMLGTGTSQPMTVQSVSVWQASAANNLSE